MLHVTLEDSVGHDVDQLVHALKPSQRSCLANHVIDAFACIGCHHDSIARRDLAFPRDPVSASPKVIDVGNHIISHRWLVGPHLFEKAIIGRAACCPYLVSETSQVSEGVGHRAMNCCTYFSLPLAHVSLYVLCTAHCIIPWKHRLKCRLETLVPI